MDRLDQNYLLNGHFGAWQRGTSFTLSGSASPATADKTIVSQTAFSTLNATVSRSTDVPSVAESKHFFNYSLQYTVNTSESTPATGFGGIFQKIEKYIFDDIVGEDIKVSFWVKSSVAGDYTLHLFAIVGTPHQFYKTRFTINSASTWEKKIISIPKMTSPSLYSSSLFMEAYIQLFSGSTYTSDTGNDEWVTDRGNNLSVTGHVNLNETTSATFNLTGFKLGIDNGLSTDQEFSLHNGSSIADFQACQRYYVDVPKINQAFYYNGSAVTTYAQYPVLMRATPSVVLYFGGSNNVIRSYQSGALPSSTVTGNTNRGINVIGGGTYTAGHTYQYGYRADASL